MRISSESTHACLQKKKTYLQVQKSIKNIWTASKNQQKNVTGMTSSLKKTPPRHRGKK